MTVSSWSAGVEIPWYGEAKSWTIWRGQHEIAWGGLAEMGSQPWRGTEECKFLQAQGRMC